MIDKTFAFLDALLPPAMLGTARATLSPEVLRGLNALGMPTDEMTNTHILLEAAAFYAQNKKISMTSIAWSANLPILAVQNNIESLAYLSEPLCKSFQTILSLRRLCLQEFSLMAQDNQFYLPHQLLPVALNYATQFPETWDFLALLFDDRAWWLMQQHDTWNTLANKPYHRQTLSSIVQQEALDRVKKVKEILQHRSGVLLDHDWIYFKEAAYFLPPSEIAYWLDFWLQHPAFFQYRNKPLHDFTAILDFRANFLNEFHQQQL